MDDEFNIESGVKAALDFAAENLPAEKAVHILNLSDYGPEFGVVSVGRSGELTPLTPKAAPDRMTGETAFHDAASFVEYVKSRQSERVRLYAPDDLTVEATLNAGDVKTPDFEDYTATLIIKTTEEWNTLCSWADGSAKTRQAALEWCEDHHSEEDSIFGGTDYETLTTWLSKMTGGYVQTVEDEEHKNSEKVEATGDLAKTHRVKLILQPIEGGPTVGVLARFKAHAEGKRVMISVGLRRRKHVLRLLTRGPAPLRDGQALFTPVYEKLAEEIGKPVLW